MANLPQPERGRNLSTRRPAILIHCLILGSLVGGHFPAARAATPGTATSSHQPRLAEGEWVARFETLGTTVTEGFLSGFSYVGNARFSSEAGVLIGDWNAQVSSSMQMTQGGCTLRTSSEGTMTGKVEGFDTDPSLRDLSFAGTITTEDCKGNIVRHPTSSTTAANLQVPRGVHLVWATCEQAYGYLAGSGPLAWHPELPPYRPIDAAVDDRFYATRLSSLRHSEAAEEYMEAVDELVADTSALLRRIAEGEGPLDGAILTELDDLLAWAEALGRDIRRTPACEFVERDGYASILADSVARLLQYALAHPERFSASDLYRLILAGIRTGLFNPRPVYVFGTEALISALNEELARRLETTTECVELTLLGQAALAMANGELLDRAEAAAAASCGG